MIKEKLMSFVKPYKPLVTGMVLLALSEIAVPKIATAIVSVRKPLEKLVTRG